MSKVSICVPVYNVEQYIGRCLDSLQCQTIKDIEIIVVDDCSPDGSMTIVQQYAVQDPRIKIVKNEQNSGLMRTRQTGYLAASGDYIMFCDSDDTLPPTAAEDLLSVAVLHNSDIVVGNMEYIPVEGSYKTNHSSKLNYGHDKISVLKSALHRELMHNMCGKLFSKHILKDFSYNVYDGCTNSEDLGAFYQIAVNSSRTDIVDNCVYYYYQNVQSSSQVFYSEKALKSMFLMRKLAIDSLAEYVELHSDMNRWIIDDVLSLYPRYNNNHQLDELLSEYHLKKFFMPYKILRYCGLRKGLRHMLKYYYPTSLIK